MCYVHPECHPSKTLGGCLGGCSLSVHCTGTIQLLASFKVKSRRIVILNVYVSGINVIEFQLNSRGVSALCFCAIGFHQRPIEIIWSTHRERDS